MKKLLVISGGTLIVSAGGIYLATGGTVTILVLLAPIAVCALSIFTATLVTKWIVNKGDKFVEELVQSFQPAQAA